MKTIFLDMDEVITLFLPKYEELAALHNYKLDYVNYSSDYEFLKKCVYENKIFSHLEINPDANTIIDMIISEIIKSGKLISLVLLTSVASRDNIQMYKEVKSQKLEWLSKHNIFYPVMFVNTAAQKVDYCSNGCCLIDDNKYTIDKWNEVSVNKTGILYTAGDSLNKLNKQLKKVIETL